MLQRKQFTFYRSFFEAIETITVKHQKADMYTMVCDYALNGILPDMERLTAIQKANMRIIMPFLDTARQKAEAGLLGGSKTKAKQKQTESKIKLNNNINNNINTNNNIKNKINDTASVSEDRSAFDIFWDLYPKKVGKEKARQAFHYTDVPLEELLRALEQQKNSYQWARDDGVFIPNPAVWLAERRWEDELPMLTGSAVKAGGGMGEAEREAIRRMLAEG